MCACERVCGEPEIIVDHNHKGKRQFSLHLRESQILKYEIQI